MKLHTDSDSSALSSEQSESFAFIVSKTPALVTSPKQQKWMDQWLKDNFGSVTAPVLLRNLVTSGLGRKYSKSALRWISSNCGNWYIPVLLSAVLEFSPSEASVNYAMNYLQSEVALELESILLIGPLVKASNKGATCVREWINSNINDHLAGESASEALAVNRKGTFTLPSGKIDGGVEIDGSFKLVINLTSPARSND